MEHHWAGGVLVDYLFLTMEQIHGADYPHTLIRSKPTDFNYATIDGGLYVATGSAHEGFGGGYGIRLI